VQRTPAADRTSTPLLFDPNLRTPFVQQWNLSIQRQIQRDTVLELAYVGSHGTHMFRMLNANQAVVTPEFLDGFRQAQKGIRTGTVGKLLDTYGATLPSSITTNLTNNDVGAFITSVTTGTFNGTVGGRMTSAGLGLSYFNNPQFTVAALGCSCTDTSYNALQISVNRRFGQGLMFQTNYTWGKSLDDISDDTDGAGQGLLIPTDSNNRRLDRGRSGFDIRHQFRAGAVYELPFGPGKRWLTGRLLSRVVGGWTVNSIIDWSSGYPFSVSSARSTIFPGVSMNAAFDGDPTSIGSVVKTSTTVSYFSDAERAKFSTPAVGTYGAGRNIFTGPGFFQTDLSLHKTIVQVGERLKLELRGEAFNVFNNVNFSQPNATSTNASFGVISSVRVPPRILQVAAKILF
jgi:hypothetical protein